MLVTLRSTRMYEFIDRLINIALPRAKVTPEGLKRDWRLIKVEIIVLE